MIDATVGLTPLLIGLTPLSVGLAPLGLHREHVLRHCNRVCCEQRMHVTEVILCATTRLPEQPAAAFAHPVLGI